MDDLRELLERLRECGMEYEILLLKMLTKVNDFDTPYAPAEKDFSKTETLVNDFDTP